MTHDGGHDPTAEARRRMLARATLYVYAFLTAGIVVAVGGAALMAWLLTRVGLPFRETWIALAIIIVLPSVIVVLWRAATGRTGKRQ
ncbi:MAG: hypothetical protein ACREM1_21555 [Longimicrobiales bacterium]